MSKFKIKYRFKITDQIQPSDMDYFHWKVTDDGELVIGLYPYFDVEEDHKGKFLKTATLTTSPFADLATEIKSCTIDADIAPASLTNWFVNLFNLETLTNFSKINTANIKSFENLFSGCSKLTNLGDIGEWNVSNITTMKKMFYNCSSLASVSVLGDWGTQVSKVTDLSYMFAGCSSLVDLSGVKDWSTLLTYNNIEGLFQNCSKLTTIDLTWGDSSAVTSIAHLFENCSALTTVFDLTAMFSDSALTDISYAFAGCQTDTVNTIVDGFTFTNVLNADYAFYDLDKDLTAASDEILILNTVTLDKVKTVEAMFAECALLKTIRVSSNWGADASTNLEPTSNVFHGSLLLANAINGSVYSADLVGSTMMNSLTGYLTYNPTVGTIYLTIHEYTDTNPTTGLEETFNQLVLSSDLISDDYKQEGWDDLHNQLITAGALAPFGSFTTAAYTKNSLETKQIIVLGDIYPSTTMGFWFSSSVNNHLVLNLEADNWFDAIPQFAIDKIHTDYVTSLQSTFSGIYQDVIDISNWDTSKVTSMENLFFNAHANTINMPSGDSNYEDVTNLKTVFAQARIANTLTWTAKLIKDNINATQIFSGYIGPMTDVKLRFMQKASLSSAFLNAALRGSSVDGTNGKLFIDIGTGLTQSLVNWSNAFDGVFIYDPLSTIPATYDEAKTSTLLINLYWSTSYPIATPLAASSLFARSKIKSATIPTANFKWDATLYTGEAPFVGAVNFTNYDVDHIAMSDYSRYITLA